MIDITPSTRTITDSDIAAIGRDINIFFITA